MNNQILKQYAEIRQQIKSLEILEDSMREQILSTMQKEHQSKVESDIGSFTVATRLKWVYTAKVKKLEDAVKIEKTKEQEKGMAQAEETNYLVFKSNQE